MPHISRVPSSPEECPQPVHPVDQQHSLPAHCRQSTYEIDTMSEFAYDPRILVYAPLHTAELLVSLFREFGLHAYHGFEAGIKVRHSQVEQLGNLGDELVV